MARRLWGGYTQVLGEAGRYGREEAAQIVADANIVAFHECMIPVEQVDLEEGFDLEEGDRQLVLLSLALCALDRPGFDLALAKIAEQLQGGPMYEQFKMLNVDRFKPTPLT